MRQKAIAIWAFILIVTGTIGFGVVLVFGLDAPSSGGFSSNGQRIYYTGADATGPIPRTVAGRGMMGFAMMGELACVDCHGEDGRGGRVGMMLGPVDISDIRYSTLNSPHAEDGESAPGPGWSDADIARAIRDGVEPNGERLRAPMPRWDMTDAQVSDVIQYLKELSAR